MPGGLAGARFGAAEEVVGRTADRIGRTPTAGVIIVTSVVEGRRTAASR